MAQLSLSLLLFLFSTFCITSMANPVDHTGSQTRAVVEKECQGTRYPELCVKCLSNYPKMNKTDQGPQQLPQMALTVSLVRAWQTRAYVTKVAAQYMKAKDKDYQAVKDCLDQINDSVGQLSQSIKELRRINQDREVNFVWHMGNVESWVSAALTDATMCIDGFSRQAMGGKVKATIKAKVQNVVEVTSNALALFNRYAARHRAKGATTKP